jgi:GNAT superfamily N-acetyltransferase
MREIDGFHIVTVADDSGMAERIQELSDRVWPKFVTQAGIPKNHTLRFDWFGIYRRWPHLQFALLNPDDGALVGAGNALTLAYDGPAEDLPDEGWNWVMHQAVLDLEAGRTPTTGSALAVTLDPNYRGKQLSRVVLAAMKSALQETGVTRFFAPVRPTTKARYPITPMETFIQWKNADGLPLDPWMRVHVRMGAKVIKACNHSQPLADRVERWEKWLDLPLPSSGIYVAPGLLAPLHVDREADEGVCFEPNVWMEHPL